MVNYMLISEFPKQMPVAISTVEGWKITTKYLVYFSKNRECSDRLVQKPPYYQSVLLVARFLSDLSSLIDAIKVWNNEFQKCFIFPSFLWTSKSKLHLFQLLAFLVFTLVKFYVRDCERSRIQDIWSIDYESHTVYMIYITMQLIPYYMGHILWPTSYNLYDIKAIWYGPYHRSWKRKCPCNSLPFSDKRIERCSTWLWRVSCDRKFNKFHVNNHIRKHESEWREELSRGFKFVLIFLRMFSTNQMGLMIHLKTRFRVFIAWLFHSVCNPTDHMIHEFTKARLWLMIRK